MVTTRVSKAGRALRRMFPGFRHDHTGSSTSLPFLIPVSASFASYLITLAGITVVVKLPGKTVGFFRAYFRVFLAFFIVLTQLC